MSRLKQAIARIERDQRRRVTRQKWKDFWIEITETGPLLQLYGVAILFMLLMINF